MAEKQYNIVRITILAVCMLVVLTTLGRPTRKMKTTRRTSRG